MKKRSKALVKRARKSGGHFTSAPGSPPMYDKGYLRESISYSGKDGEYVVGPKKNQGRSSGATILEKGGTITRTETVSIYDSEMGRVVKTRKTGRSKSKSAKKSPVRLSRPKTKRNGKTYKYRYFYSYEAWDRARKSKSGEFVRWCNSFVKRQTKTYNVSERPYMEPAFEKEITKFNDRFRRACK